MSHAVVAGVGGFVPADHVDSDTLSRRLGLADGWVQSRTGIERRHHAEPGVGTTALAVESGRRALASADMNTVDALIVATATPDHPIPATAPAVAAELGLGPVPAFDIGAVCAGYVYALAVGASLIESGLAGSVLVAGAEVMSAVVDPDDPNTGPLFGDGAGALVLRAGGADEAGRVEGFDLGSDGAQAELIRVEVGGSRQPYRGVFEPSATTMRMNGKKVFTEAVTRMSESCAALLGRTGYAITDVDRVVGHQANVRILHAIARQLDLPKERLVTNVDRVGNTSAASIPLALVDAAVAGEIRAGQRLLLTAFGGGLAWGSAMLTWPQVTVQPSGSSNPHSERHTEA